MLIDVNVLNIFFDIFFPHFFLSIKYEYAVYVLVYEHFSYFREAFICFLFIKIDIHK